MRALLLMLLLVSAPARAELALLRPLAVVDDAVVRLSDLFDNAGVHAMVAIAPAPAPGRRMVLETAQLLALARSHGIAWRPLAGNERVVVERPGRPFPRDEIDTLLRADLVRLGLDPEAELELPGFIAPMVPLGAFVQAALEQAQYDGATQRFGATLVVAADGMPTLRMRLAGRAVTTVPVVVAARRLGAGEVVGPHDVKLVRSRIERMRPGLAQALDQVVGQQLRRPAGTDIPFALVDLGAPTVVEKNSVVAMLVEAPGLTMTAQGRALEAAGRGATVPVMNLASRQILEAVVLGPGRVRVPFGAAPIARVPEQGNPTQALAAARNTR